MRVVRRASRGDLQVRLEATIGIDLRRREGQDLLLDHRFCRALEGAQEEADVADSCFDVGVGWHDEKHDPVAQAASRGGHGQRPYRGRRATDAPGGGRQPTLPDYRNQQRP